MAEIKKVATDGTTRYYNENGKLHRDGDKPAVIESNGTDEYWVNGQRHRDGDEPAVIESDGSKEYWVNGQRHRDGDEPAVIWVKGTKDYWLRATKEYWVNGQRHRDGDEPAVIWADGSVEYWVNGVCYMIIKHTLTMVNDIVNHIIEFYDGENKLHRDGDKPAIISFKEIEKVYRDGELITDYDELTNFTPCDLEYYVNGNRHREGDKPAFIHHDGTKEYWVNGVEYFPSESKKQKPKSVWEKMKMLFNIR